MTTRTTRLLALILVSLAACGDDGNPGTNSVCGDGTREGAEQCDDGNTAAGDGCSASCTTELSMSCGNGAVEGTEQCDDGNITSGDGCSAMCSTESPAGCGDGNVVGNEECDDGNTMNGDGCSSTCQDEVAPNCGNGTLQAGETCDDGDAMSNDGCSSLCMTETGFTCTGTPSVCTMATPAGTCAAPFVLALTGTPVLTATATGTTAASTNQVPMALCSGGLPNTGVGKDHVYRFTLTDTRDVSIQVADTTAFDSVIRVLSVPCDPSMDIKERAGFDGCADEDGTEEIMEFTALPAGTYYVVIDGFTATDAGAYSFTVTARPTLCGNGLLDPVSVIPGAFDEGCDDGDGMSADGCSARCDEEPGFTCVDSATPPPASTCTQTCGNGDPDAGESCDDGDTMGGDGCSATCQTEPGFSCVPATLAVPSVCTMIVCGNGISEAGETCDDGDMMGADGCSATCQTEPGFSCTAGTGVATPSVCTMSCGNGTLQTGEECDDSNTANGDRCSATCLLESDTLEIEPNGTSATAQAIGFGNHIIRGSFSGAGDVDLYTFTLSSPATIHLETYDRIDSVTPTNYQGVGTLTNVDCFLNDTVMHLFAPGVDVSMPTLALYSDDDDGSQTCSYIGSQDSASDGTGDTADTTQGVNLPAGTYTIRLVDFDDVAVTRYILDIKISSTTVPPAAGTLLINEVMPADNMSDTNCDGSTTGTVDEFIELVNFSSNTLDLAGVTVAETGAPATPRHTFAAGTTIAPGKSIVLWGGGAPACAGVTNFAVAAAGLALNDDGDTVTIASGGGTPVTLATLAFTDAQAEVNVSFNRSPDITGTSFALHTAVAGAVGAFSPGKKSNGTAF